MEEDEGYLWGLLREPPLPTLSLDKGGKNIIPFLQETPRKQRG